MSSEASYFEEALAPQPDIRDRVSLGKPLTSTEPRAVLPQPYSERPDEELISEIAQRRNDALSTIFRRYASPIRHIGLKILKNQQEAEDLVQEVFLLIYNSAAQFNPSHQRAGSWIVHIAYQRAFDRRRYLNTRQFCNELSIADVNGEHYSPLAQNETADQVFSGILCEELLEKYETHLTPNQRLVIQLFFFEGYTLKEIATIIGQSAGNVRNHFYRGMDQLRRSILPEMSRSK